LHGISPAEIRIYPKIAHEVMPIRAIFIFSFFEVFAYLLWL